MVIVALSIAPAQARSGDSVFMWLAFSTPEPLQKILHIAAYAVLALLWMWTFDGLSSATLRVIVALGLTVATGTALEYYQLSVPGRYGTLLDVFLNVVGAVVGLLIAFFML